MIFGTSEYFFAKTFSFQEKWTPETYSVEILDIK